jgi:hypothetical protein
MNGQQSTGRDARRSPAAPPEPPVLQVQFRVAPFAPADMRGTWACGSGQCAQVGLHSTTLTAPHPCNDNRKEPAPGQA